jgi:hypothetical protein
MKLHPSQLILERLSVDDLPSEVIEQTRAHTEICGQCHSFVSALRAERSERLRAVSAETFMLRLERRQQMGVRAWVSRLHHRRAWFFGFATTCAAALLGLVWLGRPPTTDVRFKGDGATLHLRRGEVVRLFTEADELRAGDDLRLVVTTSKPGPLAVWFVDAGGRVDRFFIGTTNGGEMTLPGSAVVEPPCRDLWLILATGDAANPATEVTLRNAVSGGPHEDRSWLPSGAMTRLLRCE